MKNFLAYYFEWKRPVNWVGFYLPFNYLWTFSSIGFIIAFLLGGYAYTSPALYTLSTIPFLMLCFNVVTEYNCYAQNGISAKKMTWLFFGLSGLVMLYVILRIFTGI